MKKIIKIALSDILEIPNCIKYTLICLLFFIAVFAKGNNKYPDPYRKDYTKEQIHKLLKQYEQEKDTVGLAYTYLAYAKNQEEWNDPDESPVASYRKSMEFFRILGDSTNFYETVGSLGYYFMDRPIFHKYAEEYLAKSMLYYRRNKMPAYEMGHLINLANVYIQDFKLKPAHFLLKRAELLNESLKDLTTEGRICAARSDLSRHELKFEEGIVYAGKSLEIGRKLKINWLEAVSLFYMGICQRSVGRYKEAFKSFEDCQKITEQYISLNQLRRAVYSQLDQSYILIKDYQNAYKYSDLYRRASEDIVNSKVEEDIRSVNEYQLIRKQKEELVKIALEKKLSDAELDKLRFRQQLYILSIILALALAGILAFTFFSRRKLNRMEDEKVLKNLQIETLNALINGQEQERLRISQELHDGLGTLLSRIKILSGSSDSHSSQITRMVDEACSEVRNISGNLQPNTLIKFGLIRAIQDLILKQKSTSPQIIFQHFGKKFSIPEDKNLMIYRIIQELLANALKHSQAEEIIIQIVYQEQSSITLTVEDDGIGFHENAIGTDSSGWSNIRSRVKYLNGNLTLQTDAATGTSVTILIPF
ncbi:Histidine kinase [Pseudarcicella hirudinis]|uniref:histidine kinase n=1 Tax=Pseudarcicella hirudinis TaxID=1079859 RepID=A0A1I5XYV0_9BACT|nr:ATP-binding protein [Pseudarcicella hirudinis]SFQ36907.1 Histidine kinase [Pseudarcicella hirudinis]